LGENFQNFFFSILFLFSKQNEVARAFATTLFETDFGGRRRRRRRRRLGSQQQ